MRAKKYYSVAIYLRLSRDDTATDGGTESNSISSQREIIRSYIRQQEDMEVYDTYVDDGWSGVNFDRPEFKRMMRDIEAGHVDCVIVKDLSRLGRDYIEAGRLIQKTFPAFSVRFIALNDRFDSLTADYNETALVVPVKNFINDSYCRDISNKVRSHLKVKREKGEFVGAFCVYGYVKDPENHNTLIADEYAAEVVRKIFAWKLEGYSNLAIAEKLEQAGILSPMEYKKSQGVKHKSSFGAGVKAKWSSVAVKRILSNEIYLGTLVQGKEEKVNYKVKKIVKKQPQEWTRVAGTHEAIVSEEDFYIVQDLLQRDMRAGDGEAKAHMYAGILYCGDCMKPMLRRVSRYKGQERVSFICSTKNEGGECTRHAISQADLNHIVLWGLRQQIALFLDKGKVLAAMEQMEVRFEEVVGFDSERKRLHKEQDKYVKLRAALYEDLKRELITEEDFRSFREIYEKRYLEMEQAISNQEETIKKLFRAGVTAGKNLERMRHVMQITELDRLTLLSFVKRILVYEDKRVFIELRYRELFSRVVMPDYVATAKGGEESQRC